MFSKASILSPSKPPHGSRCRPELSHQLHPSSQESPRPASAALQLSSKQLRNKLQPFLHGPHQPLQPHHLLQGKWRWNQKVNNACLNIKWQVSNLLDPSSLVSRHQQLLQCTWLFRQHPWYTPLPCYQPMSKPRQYYFNAAAYWKKVFTVQLPPLGFPPGPLHSNTRPHTCWTVGELCGGRALPPTLPTDSGDLSPSRLRWPCPQNFCTTRSPFHIIPGFTHRGQGSLFFGIRGETYCLNTHFLKQIS